MSKVLLLVLIVLNVNVFASKKVSKPVSKIPALETCFKSEDSLDREFCEKKRMKAIDEEFQLSLTKFQGGYTQAEKDQAKIALNKDIETNKEIIKLLTDELMLKQNNLAKLDSLLSNEEKEKSEQDNASKKQKEEAEKIKKALKKIFK
jgi:hypothetical protein